MKDVRITKLIDPDKRLYKGRVGQIKEKAGNTPECLQDVRKALEDKSLDAVSIATPNHWHSLMTIWACQAGKGRLRRKAVQSQRLRRPPGGQGPRGSTSGSSSTGRNSAATRAAPMKSPVFTAANTASCSSRKGTAASRVGASDSSRSPSRRRRSISISGSAPRPSSRTTKTSSTTTGTRFWDTGNRRHGEPGRPSDGRRHVGYQGWNTCAKSVWSLGGRWVNEKDYKDQGQTPNMELSVLDFGDVKLVFETRGLVDKAMTKDGKKFPRNVSNEFYTTEGMSQRRLAVSEERRRQGQGRGQGRDHRRRPLRRVHHRDAEPQPGR